MNEDDEKLLDDSEIEDRFDGGPGSGPQKGSGKLTEEQFSNIQDQIDNSKYQVRNGKPLPVGFKEHENNWESAISMPDRTFEQRQARHSAISSAGHAMLELLGK